MTVNVVPIIVMVVVRCPPDTRRMNRGKREQRESERTCSRTIHPLQRSQLLAKGESGGSVRGGKELRVGASRRARGTCGTATAIVGSIAAAAAEAVEAVVSAVGVGLNSVS